MSSVIGSRRLRKRRHRGRQDEPPTGRVPPKTEFSEQKLSRDTTSATSPVPKSGTTPWRFQATNDEDRHGPPHCEFLVVLSTLQKQKDLGLHVNEKGNQICQLSWADFIQRVPFFWTEEYPNVCPLCKKRLSSRFSLSRHYIDVHHREEKKLPPPARCPFCSKILYNQSTLNRHLQTVHKGRSPSSSAAARRVSRSSADHREPAFFCPLCLEHHEHRAEVARHVQLMRLQSCEARRLAERPILAGAELVSRLEDASSTEEEDSVNSDEADTDRTDVTMLRLGEAGLRSSSLPPYPCSVCSKTYSDQEQLVTHMASHLREKHSESPSVGVCPLCEESVAELVRHIRDYHCRVCVRCGLVLPEALMERHLTAHDLKMAFWCPVCGQREDCRQLIMRHIGARHEYIAEGSQFQCGSCGHVRSHNLVTHCLKHARHDALTAYWFKMDVLTPLEQRGLEAGRLLRSAADDPALHWLPVWAEPAASVSVQLLRPSDSVAPPAGLDAVALLSAALCPVCAGPVPSGRQLGAHLLRHGELPLLLCPGCPRTFSRPALACRHGCAQLLCLLCGLQVAPRRVADHWQLHGGHDPVCRLLTPAEPDTASDDEPSRPPPGWRSGGSARPGRAGAVTDATVDPGEVCERVTTPNGVDLRRRSSSSGGGMRPLKNIKCERRHNDDCMKSSLADKAGEWAEMQNGDACDLNGVVSCDGDSGDGCDARGGNSRGSPPRRSDCDRESAPTNQDNVMSTHEESSRCVEDVAGGSVTARSPRHRGRSGSSGRGSGPDGDTSTGRDGSGASTFQADADGEQALACEFCPLVLRSVSQLRRHRLHRHGEWRGPLSCPACPLRFFLAAHQRVHHCSGRAPAAAALPVCERCGAAPAAGRPTWLVSGDGRRLQLTVCARCDCPLPQTDAAERQSVPAPASAPVPGRSAGTGRRQSGPAPAPLRSAAAACGECDAPLTMGGAALLQTEPADCAPGPCAARLCVPCAELRLTEEPRLAARLWRPEATLGALWCPSCCQPQVSLHQLRLHSLRQHADRL